MNDVKVPLEEALDIAKIVFVSASAGSGKTTMLVKRFLKLILTGIKIDKILCLTFTRNGAAEMKERIINQVMSLMRFDDHRLAVYLEKELFLFNIDLNLVKQRFFYLIDNPDSLRIETIHSYCYQLISKFSYELELPAHCQIIDQEEATELMNSALKNLFLKISSDDSELLSNFYQFFSESNIIEDFKNLSSKCYYQVNRPRKLKEIISEIEEIKLNFLKSVNIINADIPIILEINQLLINDHDEIDKFEELKKIFFTKTNQKRAKLFNKAHFDKYPDACDKLILLQNHLFETYNNCQLKLNNYLENLYSFILRLLANEFYNLKRDAGKISFDEVIDYCLELITNSEFKDFVLYDIDHKFDHLMLDEAQDTNYKQWEIVKALTEEFYLNEKSIFVVGDYKQSIYRFQGAEPKSFYEAKLYFQEKFADNFIQVELNYNYRSASNIITFVNQVCEIIKDKITIGDSVKHLAKSDLAGIVRLIELGKEQDSAQTITKDLKEWLDNDRLIAGEESIIQPGDIMILFRSRGQLYNDVANNLSKLGIAYTSDEKSVLYDHFFIKDLIALAEFYNNPYDDLNLACILRSPFYRLSDQLIEDLCFHRDTSLYNSLCACQLEQVKIILEKLNSILSLDFSSTREFFRKIVLQKSFLKIYINEYGSIIKNLYQVFFDILDSTQASLSLAEFSSYLKTLDNGIENQISTENKIKLMTIHASKGLEAKIVIIADIKSLSTTKENYFIHEDKFYYKMNSSFSVENFDRIREEMSIEDDKEYFRLGYVALTRGKNELHMYGKKIKDDEPDNWHKAANIAMQQSAKLEIRGENHYYQIGDFSNNEQQQENKHQQSSELENSFYDYFDINFPELYYYTNESPSLKNDEKIAPSPLADFYAKVNYGSNYHKLLNISPVTIDNDILIKRYESLKGYYLLNNMHKLFLETKNYYHELSFAKKEEKGYKLIISKAVIDLLIEKDNLYEVVEFKSSASNIDEFLLEAYNKQLGKYTKILQELITDKPLESYLYFVKDDKKIYKKEVDYVD